MPSAPPQIAHSSSPSHNVTSHSVNRRFSVAPMMDYTDRYCRYFHRLLTQHSLLYTEMVTTGAIIHGDHQRHLAFRKEEHPIALQLGGSDPKALAQATGIAADYRYDEINLNCGCPSDRVQSGQFGAVLMKSPNQVAECFKAMQSATDIPITIKHRIGVDEQDSYSALCDFVGTVAQAGCNTFIVHARKAWLQGLSPKQNREVPPLDYQTVERLKADFPEQEIIINGGITSIAQTQALLSTVDGVMVGREAYHNPYLLAAVDSAIFGDTQPPPSRRQVMEQFIAFVEQEITQRKSEPNAPPLRLIHLCRHILGLYQGQPGARLFRRHISENAHRTDAGIDVLWQALDIVESTSLESKGGAMASPQVQAPTEQ